MQTYGHEDLVGVDGGGQDQVGDEEGGVADCGD